MPYNHYMEHGGDGGFSALGVIWVVLLAVLVIGLIVALLRWGFGGGLGRNTTAQPTPAEPAAPGESPIDILDRRLAAGEIDVEDYERRREVLTGSAGKPGST